MSRPLEAAPWALLGRSDCSSKTADRARYADCLQGAFAEARGVACSLRRGSTWNAVQVSRDAEEYRAGRLDENEARTYRYDNPIAADGPVLSDFAKRIAPPSASGMPYVQCVFEEGQEAPDRWIYCTSTRLSSRLLRECESDSCVMIRDGAASFMDVAPCAYIGRHRHSGRSVVNTSGRPRVRRSLRGQGID